jgi:hypothetical protein
MGVKSNMRLEPRSRERCALAGADVLVGELGDGLEPGRAVLGALAAAPFSLSEGPASGRGRYSK